VAFPLHASANPASYPTLDAIPPEMIAITRKIIVIMKDKSPYGIAKHAIFFFPVKHPRQATKSPTIPIPIIPLPMAFPASVNPGIAKICLFSELIGI